MTSVDERQYRIHSELFLRRISQEIGGRSSRHAVLLKIRILKILQTYEPKYLHVQKYFFLFVSIICFLKGFFNDVFQEKLHLCRRTHNVFDEMFQRLQNTSNWNSSDSLLFFSRHFSSVSMLFRRFPIKFLYLLSVIFHIHTKYYVCYSWLRD